MIKFPNLIEWMDEMTMDELHKLHDEVEGTESFSEFVGNEYEAHKEMWQDEMSKHREIRFQANDEKDICDEMAKDLLCVILNKGTLEIKDIICQQEFAPDHHSAIQVVEAFWYKIIPAIEKTLKELN